MEFKRFLIQILFEKGSETSSRLIMFSENFRSQTENFLLLYVLGLLLHSDASMQQLDIPVIVICIFFLQKSIYPKFLVFVIFPPFMFCMLFGIIKQI